MCMSCDNLKGQTAVFRYKRFPLNVRLVGHVGASPTSSPTVDIMKVILPSKADTSTKKATLALKATSSTTAEPDMILLVSINKGGGILMDLCS